MCFYANFRVKQDHHSTYQAHSKSKNSTVLDYIYAGPHPKLLKTDVFQDWLPVHVEVPKHFSPV